MDFKNFILNEPIINDYLIQMNIIDKLENYKGIDYLPQKFMSYLNTDIWNDDINFINDIINKIKDFKKI